MPSSLINFIFSDSVIGIPLTNHVTSGLGSPVSTALNLTVSPS